MWVLRGGGLGAALFLSDSTTITLQSHGSFKTLQNTQIRTHPVFDYANLAASPTFFLFSRVAKDGFRCATPPCHWLVNNLPILSVEKTDRP